MTREVKNFYCTFGASDWGRGEIYFVLHILNNSWVTKVVSASVLDNWPRIRRESLMINEQTPREALCAWIFMVDNSVDAFHSLRQPSQAFESPWQPQKRRKCKQPLNWSVLGEANSTSGHRIERNFLLPITLERKFLGNNALVPFSSFSPLLTQPRQKETKRKKCLLK